MFFGVFCSALLLREPATEKHRKNTGPDVDVVYTWVAEPTQAEYDRFLLDCQRAHIAMVGGTQRFRDFGTMQRSLQSVERNLPWVRHIFVVTQGAAPCWLKASPRLTVVPDGSLWPEELKSRDYPTHNSQAIEAHLHRIPGLAEHFIYFNDDMFVGRPLARSFFFSDRGQPIAFVSNALDAKYTRNLKYNRGWHTTEGFDGKVFWKAAEEPQGFMGTHMAIAMSQSVIRKCQAKWPNFFDTCSATKCRGPIPAEQSPFFTYQWFGLNAGLVKEGSGRFIWLHELLEEPNSLAYFLSEILRSPPDLFCINDDFTDRTLARKELDKFYEVAYDRPSSLVGDVDCSPKGELELAFLRGHRSVR